MKIKMILPALTEAKSPYWRPIKYSLFPPLGLATLVPYCDPADEIDLQDEHVETLNVGDTPDLVIIQVYITNAFRSYALADHYRQRGAYVCLGGLHVSSLPDEAGQHADSIFIGPGEETFPKFLTDFRRGRPQAAGGLQNHWLVGRGTEERLRLGVQGILFVEKHLPGQRTAPKPETLPEALYVCRRLEEIRAALEFHHQDQRFE